MEVQWQFTADVVWAVVRRSPGMAGRECCMDGTKREHRRHGWIAALALVATMACGCQTVRTPEEKIAKSNLPREFTKVTMPDYVVEPPDLLVVDVLEALPGRRIEGERLVKPDGKISLGFYGEVYVAGLTTDEVKEKIVLHLRKYLSDEALGLSQMSDDGETYEEIAPRDTSRVFVDVTSYNSKFYYVQGDVAAPGRMPITGNETVLDAINFAGGLISTANPQNIRLVRPAPPGACCEQVLPVNYAAIVNSGDPTTNYQLMPGDRLMVFRDPIVRFTIFVDRIAAPFQTALNSALQYGFTARTIKAINVPLFGGNGTGTTTTTTTNLPSQPGAR